MGGSDTAFSFLHTCGRIQVNKSQNSMPEFLQTNWFQLLQSIFLFTGFIIAAVALRNDLRARRMQNLLKIKEHYNSIWSQLFSFPELNRVQADEVDLAEKALTEKERFFVLMAIQHLFAAYEATRTKQIRPFQGMEKDIRRFFSRPIPKLIWNEEKRFQNPDFVEFVERQIWN